MMSAANWGQRCKVSVTEPIKICSSRTTDPNTCPLLYNQPLGSQLTSGRQQGNTNRSHECVWARIVCVYLSGFLSPGMKMLTCTGNFTLFFPFSVEGFFIKARFQTLLKIASHFFNIAVDRVLYSVSLEIQQCLYDIRVEQGIKQTPQCHWWLLESVHVPINMPFLVWPVFFFFFSRKSTSK